MLAGYGVRVAVLDGAPGPAEHSRAAVVHARTLESLDLLGVTNWRWREDALNNTRRTIRGPGSLRTVPGWGLTLAPPRGSDRAGGRPGIPTGSFHRVSASCSSLERVGAQVAPPWAPRPPPYSAETAAILPSLSKEEPGGRRRSVLGRGSVLMEAGTDDR